MIVLPAIDIIGGKAVRLTKGDYGTVEIFGEPQEIAAEFLRAGAKYLHSVDLDGAKSGHTDNFDTVKRLVDSGLKVEIGGGIRTIERAKGYIDAGAARVIIGTAAIKDKAFLRQALDNFGDAVAVGVDAKDGFVATDGWCNVTQTPYFEFCQELNDMGVKTVIFTDIATDGMMKGTNLNNFRALATIDGLDVIASGGVTYYEEIAALRDMGIHGVILGKALYKNLLELDKAIAVAEGKC